MAEWRSRDEREPATAPAASVVVLAYDSAPVIERALGALKTQRFDEPFEVLVVWSGSDKTRTLTERKYPDAILVGGHERILTGAARNLGIDTASGEIVAFLAADCVPEPEWLRRRVEGHRQGFDAVGGAVLCPGDASLPARAAHLIEFLDCSPNRPKAEVVGEPVYNLSFSRHVFDRRGRYDEDVACGEDTLFNRQLAEAGERILYDPDVRMVHPGPQTLGAHLRHQYWHGVWFGWLCRHRGRELNARGPFRTAVRLLLYNPVARVVRGARRILAWERQALPAAVLLAPLMALGIAASTFGAARAYLSVAQQPRLPD